MNEEKDKNKKKESCPLCRVSDETIERLKKEAEEKNRQKNDSRR